ncbi:MAG: universal stress protein [Lactobacillales bacterium]|nr:universal stress protein [Lactobacillales bacterium]
MEQEYKKILVGIDGSPQADYAFDSAVEVARRNDGQVIVVAIIQNQMYDVIGYSNVNDSVLEDEAQEYKNLLDKCAERAKKVHFENVRTEVVFGSPKELLARALPKKYDIDLIMVGQSGLNAVERFMVGSVSRFVIAHAPCDVLIVHPKKID